MRLALLPGLLGSTLLAACASGGAREAPGSSGPSGSFERARTTGAAEGSNLDVSFRTTNFVSSDLIAAPLDSAWGVLPGVWRSLGLTIDGMSSIERRLQSGAMRVHRQLGGVSLSRFIECGRSTQGPNADVYFIIMRFETALSGRDGAVTARSSMAVTGEGTGNSGQLMRCSSLGELERRIAERIAERTVARPTK